jgi:undecaprenol kinase
MMKYKNNNVWAAFKNAFLGFRYALITENNFKFHFIISFFVIFAGWIFHLSISEWCLILLTVTAVLVAELLNTAIEYTVDIASPEKRDLARRAKDVSAAAVLVTATCSVVVGLLIFLPKILPLFHLTR